MWEGTNEFLRAIRTAQQGPFLANLSSATVGKCELEGGALS